MGGSAKVFNRQSFVLYGISMFLHVMDIYAVDNGYKLPWEHPYISTLREAFNLNMVASGLWYIKHSIIVQYLKYSKFVIKNSSCAT